MRASALTRLLAVLLGAACSAARADHCTSRLDRTGAQHGPTRCVGDDGQLVYEAGYDRGRLEGERRTYYPGGRLRTREVYRQGKLDGTSFTYGERGGPRRVTSYRGGVRDGEDVQYREDGGVSQRDLYQDGHLLSRRTYHPNGKPHTADLYGEDGPLRREFYPSGVLRYEAPCLPGSRTVHGLERRYRADGQLFRETLYERGVRNGPDREYHPGGRLALERIYRRDQLVRTRAYDEQGRSLDDAKRAQVTTR